jgi:hypothetical protein
MDSNPSKPPVARTRLGARISYYSEFADAATIGIQFVLCIAAGFALGRWIDTRWFHAQGTATLIGTAFGVAAAFRSLWVTARKIQRKLAEYAKEREQALMGDPQNKPESRGDEDD